MALLKSLIKRDWFIGLVITLLFLIFAEAGVFSALDREAYNLGVKFSTAREPNEKIVVVAIDDKSLQTLGAWPWSRDVLAESMKLLTSTKPSVVGFTMPFDTAHVRYRTVPGRAVVAVRTAQAAQKTEKTQPQR
jgi:serine/threonine-protein kinase